MSNPRSYIDFPLELRDVDAAADTYKVALLPTPAIGETAAVEVAYRYDALRDALHDVEDWIDQDELIALGEQLAARLLPGRIRELFEGALKQAGRDGGVRLRLLIRNAKLAQLPWELAYLQRTDGAKDRRHFLALNPQVSFVRHVPMETAHLEAQGDATAPLRMVAATANVDGFRRLNLKKERHVIEESLQDANIDRTRFEWTAFLEQATAESLADVLLSRKVDLFHFAGHGVFEDVDVDTTSGEAIGVGAIVLAAGEDDRAAEHLGAAELAGQLKQAGVRLAVLGACNSGRHDGVSPWAGGAPALIERGIPAVVAMQFEVQDRLAIAFSKTFYAALGGGLSVDEAVAAGRQAMLGQSSEHDVDWAVPVLYMRSPDGILFPERADQPSKVGNQIRQVVEQTVEVIEQGGAVTGIDATVENGHFNVSLHARQEADTVRGTMTGATLRFGRSGNPPSGGTG
jgi:hypothetical protein